MTPRGDTGTQSHHPGAETFAQAFDAALRTRGVGLAALQRRLDAAGRSITLPALSMWRSGRRRPEGAASRAVVLEIETLLGLSPRALERHIGPSQRRPPVRAASERAFDELVGRPGFTRAANSALGIGDDLELARTSVRLVLELDDAGLAIRLSDQIVWRARVDDARVGSLNMFYDDPIVGEPPMMTGLSGCTVLGRYVDVDAGMIAFAVELDRSLRVGELAMTECEILGIQESTPSSTFEFVAERRMVEGAVQVRFAQGRLPADCLAWVIDEELDEEEPAQLVGNSVLQVRRNFGPGRFGFRWSWPGADGVSPP